MIPALRYSPRPFFSVLCGDVAPLFRYHHLILPILLLFSACQEPSAQTPSGKYAPNGGVFTPHGTLRALVVFAAIQDAPSSNPAFYNKNNWVERWPAEGLPDYVNPLDGSMRELFYQEKSDFSRQATGNEALNLSRFYRTMSQPQRDFVFLAEAFSNKNGEPVRVDIDPGNARGWGQMNVKVIEQMRKINPSFDYSRFDLRKNNPNFLFDNSDTTQNKPDGIVDYMVIIYRYNNAWGVEPAPGARNWTGSGGGFADLSVGKTAAINGVSIQDGFTMALGGGLPIPLFIHEVAHRMFNCPHYFGSNGVTGNFYYLPSMGWSSTGFGLFQCMNAWERWYLGYLNLVADVSGPSDLVAGKRFKIRDFVTTGDAIRIAIPHSKGQYLWLENHLKLSPFDTHIWKGHQPDGENGPGLADSPPGVYAYVSNVPNERTNIVGVFSDAANGFKALAADGFYDYSRSKEQLKNAWGNGLHTYKRGLPNALSGGNPLFMYRDDYDNDRKIKVDKDPNSASNEGGGAYMNREEVSPGKALNLYRGFGTYSNTAAQYFRSPAFGSGDRLGMDTNPAPFNYPHYLFKENRQEEFFLNGIEIRFLEKDTDGIWVEIHLNKYTINENVRWTGDVVLTNLSNDGNPDLIVAPTKVLTLDRSGTPVRLTAGPRGDFMNNSSFRLEKDAVLQLAANSKLVLKDSSVLILEKGARVVMGAKSQIVLEGGGRIDDQGAVFIRGRRARIVKRR